jgi:hypothetical protein
LATAYRPTPEGLVVSDEADGDYSHPPGFEDGGAGLVSATFLKMSIESAARQLEVEAIVAATAEDVRSRLGAWVSVESLDDGRCRVRMTTDALEWPTVVLCSLGVPFEVVGPPEMVEFAGICADRLRSASG